MSMKVESIIKDRLRAIDDEQSTVDLAEIVGLAEEDLVVLARPARQVRRRPLALVVAVLGVIAFGVVSLFLRSSDDTAPADTITPTTIDENVPTSLSEADLESLPPVAPAKVVDGYQPFGPVQIEYTVSESEYLPFGSLFQHDWQTPHGGLVQTARGFLALAQDPRGRAVPVRSIGDATDWVASAELGWINADTDQNRDPDNIRGRIFEAGGWYWIETLVPTRLYRSQDGVQWDEIDLPQNWILPVGFPVVDHRFVDFGDHLVGFGDGEAISVDVSSAEVTTHAYPWKLPDDGFWLSSVVIGDELHVYVSSFREQPGDTHVFEEWFTSNLTDWRGPQRPPMVYAETIGFGVSGNAESGYLAAIEVSDDDDLGANSQGLYSPDGLNWQRFNMPQDAFWVGLPATAVKIGGGQGLVTLQESSNTARIVSIWVSADGSNWQSIPLSTPESPLPTPGRFSVSVVGEAIYVYQQHRSQLHTWKVSFAAGTD